MLTISTPDGIVPADQATIEQIERDRARAEAERIPNMLREYQDAIERHVDAVAAERGYRSADSIAGYATSTNETWAAEAQVFVAWRDQVWVQTFAELEKVQSGEREQPTVADLLAGLPVIDWPA